MMNEVLSESFILDLSVFYFRDVKGACVSQYSSQNSPLSPLPSPLGIITISLLPRQNSRMNSPCSSSSSSPHKILFESFSVVSNDLPYFIFLVLLASGAIFCKFLLPSSLIEICQS